MSTRPPHWFVAATFAALALLLFYPLHVPYQNPDQDLPPFTALMEMVRGGWRPWDFFYPSALTNLLHLAYAFGLGLARLCGRQVDAFDLLAAWYHQPWLFRLLPRALAMTGGVLSLVAAWRLTALVTDRWSALCAAVLLGTSLMFVREHHHGMWDAPASTCVILALACCTGHVSRARPRTIAASGALAGLAVSFKYNAGVVLLPVILAAWMGGTSRVERSRALAVAAGGGLVALIATSPGIVLEPRRFAQDVAIFGPFQVEALRSAATAGAMENDLWGALRNGLGIPLVGTALLGLFHVVMRRERGLVPLTTFALLYAAVLARTPLVLNRYALPLAPALAILAAYGLDRSLPPRLRAGAALLLVATGLPACVSYVEFVAREDTRVAAARWLTAHVRPDARVFFPGGLGSTAYNAPDLPRLAAFEQGLPEGLPPDIQARVASRRPDDFASRRLFLRLPPGAAVAACCANSVVITAEHPAGTFARVVSSSDDIRALEGHAILLRDYPIERTAGPRTYELFDLNYVPLRGIETLLGPGPRIRLWYVPRGNEGAPADREPLPFEENRLPEDAGASTSRAPLTPREEPRHRLAEELR